MGNISSLNEMIQAQDEKKILESKFPVKIKKDIKEEETTNEDELIDKEIKTEIKEEESTDEDDLDSTLNLTKEDDKHDDVTNLTRSIATSLNQLVTMWQNQQKKVQEDKLVQAEKLRSSKCVQYLQWKLTKIDLPEMTKSTPPWKTLEPSLPRKKPRLEETVTPTNLTSLQTVTKPLASTTVKPSSQQRNRRCEPNERLQTLEDKRMYQCTAIGRLRSMPRPGSSVQKLQHFTSRLQDYVDKLKRIDHRFLHSPSIMRMVCAQLEPHMVWSWCEFAAQNWKNGKPVILTMMEFLHYKVGAGLRHWYPYTKEAMNRKRLYSDISK